MKRLVLMIALLMLGFVITPALAQDQEAGSLDGIKTYLLDKSTGLADGAQILADHATAYYELAKAAEFDYAALWATNAEAVAEVLQQAKNQWITISPVYEQMEGIVAGVPSLSEYDAIIDAGVSGEEDPQNAPDFDVTLPDGTVMSRPGNLFGLLEGSLWGTHPELITDVQADLDGDSTVGFGEVIPDANALKGIADAMATYTSDLLKSADAWEPNETDAFSALVANIPTVSDFFESWKESRFVMGSEATRTDFVVVSRLSDIKDNVSSWQAIYDGISSQIAGIDPERDQQINQDLDSLKDYVLDLYTQEQDGRRFTPEEADFYGSEAQDRAMMITGQISQAAALLNITLPE